MANSLLELRTSYDEFLRSDRFGYADRIGTAIDDHYQRSNAANASSGGGKQGKEQSSSATTTLVGHPRLRIPLSDLRSHDPRLSNALLRDPLRHIRALEAAVQSVLL